MATEIVAQFVAQKKSVPTLAQAKLFYDKQDSHFCIEGHLPGLVPLAFVRKVIMPQTTWDTLSAETKTLFDQQFSKDRLLLANTKPPFSDEVYHEMIGPKIEQQVGFCFALSNNWARPRVLPIIPFKGPEFTVMFRAYGRDIFVTLSPTWDILNAPAVYHISLAAGRSCTTAIRKGLKKTAPVLLSVPGFNDGFSSLLAL